MAAANFKVLRGLLPIAFLAVFVAGDAPKLLNKSELDELVNQGKRVVANFVQDNCPKCATFGPEFLKAASKLVDDKDVEFVLVKDKDVHIRHGVSTTPSILYFREKTPILFTDEMKADHIVNFVQNSQSAFTKSLTDDSFEHLTQAATGATTGDWLVLFLDHNQEESLMLIPTLEAAAEVLKNKVNVATVDVIQEPFLAERFEVDETPVVYFFRLGRMYGFHLPQFDVSSVVSFATGWYKNSRAIPVAVPKSPFYRKESDEWAGFEQDLTLDSILAFIAEEEAAKGGTTVNTKEKLDRLAESVADGAKQFATDAKTKLTEGARKAQEKIKESAAQASASLKESAAKAREKLKEGARKAKELLEDKDTQKKLGVGTSLVIGAVVVIVAVVCIRRRKKKVKQQ